MVSSVAIINTKATKSNRTTRISVQLLNNFFIRDYISTDDSEQLL